MASATTVKQIEELLERATEFEVKKQDNDAAAIYYRVINDERAAGAEEMKLKEQAVKKIADLFAKSKNSAAMRELMTKIRPFLSTAPKAKTAKIVRSIIDRAGEIENSANEQLLLVKESIAWAQQERRGYLRQRLECRLAALLVETSQYAEALSITSRLCIELKKLDDKLLLVETRLIESRAYMFMQNIAKAKASLTAARSNANAVYTPPSLQASMDMLSGMLHAEEKDFKTAYSYFYESFETYYQLERHEASMALCYMLLAKIMMNKPEDVPSVLTSKLALKYAGAQVDAVRTVATACRERSLHAFVAAKEAFPPVLRNDALFKTHLTALYADLLERHLLRVVEPYSRIEINRVAELIQLPPATVERHLSQLILEQKLNGILDQGQGLLILFDEQQTDKVYQKTLDTIDQMGIVVDVLFEQANALR